METENVLTGRVRYSWISTVLLNRVSTIAAISVLVAIHVFAFPWLDQSYGIVGRAFCLFYILVAALQWGVRGGVLAALLTVPLNLALSKYAGAAVLPAGILGTVGLLSGGLIFGAMSDLNQRLKKELNKRKRIEEELREQQQHLEFAVDRRMTDLKLTNEKLLREIAERERIETALRESEGRYRDLADLLPQTVFEIDNKGSVKFANKSAFATFGYDQADFDRGLRAIHMIAPEDRGRLLESMTRAFQGHQSLGGSEYKALRKDGSTFAAILYSSPIIRNEQPVGMRGLVVDITEHKSLETHLQKSQKMESVGRLAGGIAHDFNNILTSIIGYSQLGMTKISRVEPLYKDFQEILHASGRAAKLTRQLLAFSRRQITDPKITNLNEVLLDMDKMLRRLIGEDVELVTLPAGDLGSTIVDVGQIEQLIANLAVNARDAMPGGGKLTLRTAKVRLEGETPTPVRAGDYVMLSVSDNGVGMTKEVQEHIFEPFFTTKKEGLGTGLGLAMCYGIVKQNDGYIWVESNPTKGTTFKIYFPRVPREPENQQQPVESHSIGIGDETILLVEDEAAVREIVARVLRERGYKVLEAGNGNEALRVARSSGEEPVDLLLTDLVMPELGGKELSERIRAEYPDIKVLLMSGYPGESAFRKGKLEPGLTILQKPFSPAYLARKVRESLDNGARV
jgi:PAS domain S-box-containing protein